MRTSLNETECRMYLVISLIYEKIIDAEPSFEMGFYKWSQTRTKLLDRIGLSDDVWTELSDFGDSNDELQDRLAQMREKYENLTISQLIENPNLVKFDKN